MAISGERRYYVTILSRVWWRFLKEKIHMTPEDRDLMIELSKRIARETDIRKLTSWIDELNELIRSKIRELRDSERTC